MPVETIIELVFTSLVTGALAALLWTRLNHLESGQDQIRSELAKVRERMATRADVDRLREEMAVMRSDLTHVALAVGVHRPKPMEG